MKHTSLRRGAHVISAVALFGFLAIPSLAAVVNSRIDMRLTWTDTGERRVVTGMELCREGQCTPIDISRLDIWIKSANVGGDPTAKEVEVCKDKGPFAQECKVFDCYEDNVGMMSVCNFRYAYRKSCMSETCSN